jgi:aminoglycoside 6-adenylyltransferase
MTKTEKAYDALISRITAWAENRPDIRAVMIQGSRARSVMPADEWSDLDLAVMTTAPDFYLDSAEWLSELGRYWLTFTEATADGGRERRVLFEDGLDADFSIIPVSGIQQFLISGMPLPEDAAYTLRRGIRILSDKDGLLGRLLQLDIKPHIDKPPSENDYLELVNDFLYHYIWTLKKLRRGELWAAIGCSDAYMKHRLLRMAEWHAHAFHGVSYDTWHQGRYLEKWADPRVLEGLTRSFAHFDPDNIRTALLETYRLFRLLAVEVADKLHYNYPADSDTAVFKWASENL